MLHTPVAVQQHIRRGLLEHFLRRERDHPRLSKLLDVGVDLSSNNKKKKSGPINSIKKKPRAKREKKKTSRRTLSPIQSHRSGSWAAMAFHSGCGKLWSLQEPNAMVPSGRWMSSTLGIRPSAAEPCECCATRTDDTAATATAAAAVAALSIIFRNSRNSRNFAWRELFSW